jgi:thymidylate synthase
MLEEIRQETGSDGRKGWPVAVRDRIAYPYYKEDRVTEANVAVTFLWTLRDDVVPKLDKKNLALACNFYTPAGLVGMIRNILGNPYIRYILLLGEEYSSRSEDDKTELTSANALRAFFEKGLGADRKIQGFENSVYFDKNIPTEIINRVRENVQLIDLNKKMPHASFEDKIKEANRLLLSLEKKKPFLEKPMTFGYEKTSEAFPYEGGPIVIHGSTIPQTWVEVMHDIFRYGRPNLMNANTDRWVKEINNMVAVVHEPQDLELGLNPFLVPLTKEKIDAYQREILSPILPPGKAYTYGNKLRAYEYDAPHKVKNLVNSNDYKDFEFGKGSHLDKNVRYQNDFCEIDQIQDMIDVLKRDPYSKACVAITWHVQEELMRKHKSSPCLVVVQALVQDERLNLMVFFRSHDMVQGWPENAYGCAAIQRLIANGIGMEPGTLIIISGSAQIYNHYYHQVEEMLNKYRKFSRSYHDSRGNYFLEVRNKKIIVSHVNPDNGSELESFVGVTADEVRGKMAYAGDINTDHAIYLGMELQKAELALQRDLAYKQDLMLEIR